MSVGRPFEAGDRVLLIDQRERRYLITLASGKQFHSHQGWLDHDAVIGTLPGSWISLTQGTRMLALRPTLGDYQLKMKRGAQVVYPKDIGAILVHADIRAGLRVLEAGTGSGSLTLSLANAVGEGGRVVSYEVREDHLEQARRNIEAWYEGIGGKPDNVELRAGDVFEVGPHEAFDRIVLDLPEPWHGIGTTTASLAPGGTLCCYLPTVPQVSQTVEAMRTGGFGAIETFEVLLRTWNVDGMSVRPDHRMVAHTGFLIVGRKLATSPNAGR